MKIGLFYEWPNPGLRDWKRLFEEGIEQMRAVLGDSKFLAVYEQLCRRATEERGAVQKYVLA